MTFVFLISYFVKFFQIKEKQSLQQKIRNLENSIDSGTRDSSEKEIKIKELENLIAKEKSEIQRLENERSDLVAKVKKWLFAL